MANKITKAVRAEIASIAERLPADTYTARTKVVTGAEILEDDPEAVDAKGEPLKSYVKYTLPVQYPVNHKNRLESAYKSGGVEGINKYLDKYRSTPSIDNQPEAAE